MRTAAPGTPIYSDSSSPKASQHTPPSSEDDGRPLVNSAKYSAHGGDLEMEELGQKRDGQWQPAEEEDEGDNEEKGFLGDNRRRRSATSVQSFELFTPDEDRAVLKRLDRRLVLFTAILYMLSFLDRSNIGNARIAGLSSDLKLDSSQYEWLLTIFYITYIAFEWMTLMYRVVPPHVYISLCVLSWGLLASLQSIATSFPGLLLLRALLGVSEAAFGPGMPFYLSFFFRREELAYRTGVFISAAPLAISFASSLAWLITAFAQYVPIRPWRLLFLVEGFPSIIVAAIAWHVIPDSPETARFLTPRQKQIAALRLRKEKDAGIEMDNLPGRHRRSEEQSLTEKLSFRQIVVTLLDPKCYFTALMFFSCNVAFSSMPVFLPTIIREMGYTSVMSQALSAPPYLFSFIIVLLVAHLSDRQRDSRSIYIILVALMACAGYFIIAGAGWLGMGAAWRYIGIYPACAGFFAAITLIITWTINNQHSDSAKGTGVVVMNVIGQLGPLLGTKLYPDSDAPYYVRGMAVCGVFMIVVALLALGLRILLARENKNIRQKGRTMLRNDDEGSKPFMYML